MRKYLNWYSISVTMILFIASSIFACGLIASSILEEGWTLLFGMAFLLALLFFTLIILTLVRVVTHSSKGSAITLDNNHQEKKRESQVRRLAVAIISGTIGVIITIPAVTLNLGYWSFSIIFLTSIFTAPIFAVLGVIFIRLFEEIDQESIRKRALVALVSGMTGVLFTILAVFYFHFSTAHNEWSGPRPTGYGTIVEFTSRNTVKVMSPSGNVFHIPYLYIGWCEDDDCLRMHEEQLQKRRNFESLLADGTREKNNLCFPIISPPNPPVKMESEETIFRECSILNMGERRYFIDGNGNIYTWHKDYRDAYFVLITIGVFTVPIFAILGVAFYKLFERLIKKTTLS